MDMRRPWLLVLDPDSERLERLERELSRGFGHDVRVRGERDVASALAVLEDARVSEAPVALVLVVPDIGGTPGAEVLRRVRAVHPDARRALVMEWGGWADPTTAAAVTAAMALGDAEYYVLCPWRDGDMLFRRTVTEYLHEWTRDCPQGIAEINLVRAGRSDRAHEVHDLLARNGVPHAVHDASTRYGREVIESLGLEAPPELVVTFPALGIEPLVDPTNQELAEAYGVTTELAGPTEVDVAIIGAGPAGWRPRSTRRRRASRPSSSNARPSVARRRPAR